jgi:hypothetical protein
VEVVAVFIELGTVDQDMFACLVFLSARAVLVFFREEAAVEFACVGMASPALDKSAECFTRCV